MLRHFMLQHLILVAILLTNLLAFPTDENGNNCTFKDSPPSHSLNSLAEFYQECTAFSSSKSSIKETISESVQHLQKTEFYLKNGQSFCFSTDNRTEDKIMAFKITMIKTEHIFKVEKTSRRAGCFVFSEDKDDEYVRGVISRDEGVIACELNGNSYADLIQFGQDYTELIYFRFSFLYEDGSITTQDLDGIPTDTSAYRDASSGANSIARIGYLKPMNTFKSYISSRVFVVSDNTLYRVRDSNEIDTYDPSKRFGIPYEKDEKNGNKELDYADQIPYFFIQDSFEGKEYVFEDPSSQETFGTLIFDKDTVIGTDYLDGMAEVGITLESFRDISKVYVNSGIIGDFNCTIMPNELHPRELVCTVTQVIMPGTAVLNLFLAGNCQNILTKEVMATVGFVARFEFPVILSANILTKFHVCTAFGVCKEYGITYRETNYGVIPERPTTEVPVEEKDPWDTFCEDLWYAMKNPFESVMNGLKLLVVIMIGIIVLFLMYRFCQLEVRKKKSVDIEKVLKIIEEVKSGNIPE